jgi:hypothetical protein
MSLKSDNISTCRHFQNGHHNTAQIQHCPISTTFLMWVNHHVRKWFLTSKNFYRFQDVEIEQCWICAVLWRPFWKWRPVEIFRCHESIRDIIIYPPMKWRWNRTMLNLCGIVVAVSKWPPQYRTNSTLSDFNAISYVGRLWCPELIPDIEKFLPVAIFKTAIFRCHESIRDIIIYPHMKWRWNRTMLNLCGIVAAVLKMVTSRNFSMSG